LWRKKRDRGESGRRKDEPAAVGKEQHQRTEVERKTHTERERGDKDKDRGGKGRGRMAIKMNVVKKEREKAKERRGMKIGLHYYCGGHFWCHPILVEILARFDTFKGCARTPDFGQAHNPPPPKSPPPPFLAIGWMVWMGCKN
jgi:hypothetical protein